MFIKKYNPFLVFTNLFAFGKACRFFDFDVLKGCLSIYSMVEWIISGASIVVVIVEITWWLWSL